MKWFRRQNGQSLVELVLVIPLFLVFMVGILQAGRLFKARLALVALSREVPIAVSRLCGDGGCPDERRCLQVARALAGRAGVLQAGQLSLSMEDAMGIGRQGSGVVSWISSQLVGRKFTLTYRYALPGMAGWFLPRGLKLEETVYCQIDPWKNPVQRLAGMLAP